MHSRTCCEALVNCPAHFEMHLLSAITLLLSLVVGICGNFSAFSDLTERIYKETQPSTVYLIGVGDGYLSEIRKKDFIVPVTIFTFWESERSELDSIDKNVILVVQVDKSTQCYDVINKFITRLQVRRFAVIIASSIDVLQDYFLYFKDKLFTRIFGVVEDAQFAYLPYADESVQRVRRTDPLPNALSDLNGYSFRTTIQMDFPRVFWYQNRRGRMTIGGYVGQLYLSFLQKHNATFTEVFINNSSQLYIPGVINATCNGEVDISMNTYCPIEELELSYPIKFLRWTIMVPLNGYIDSDQYFLRPFTSTVWIIIGITIVYVMVMHSIKDFYVNNTVDLWLYFHQTFTFLLAQSPGTRITSAYRMHLQIMLLAFILFNLYSVHLTSFLTVSLRVKQYDTIRDLIENNVTVMMADYHWTLISHPDQHVAGFEKIVKEVENAIFLKEHNSMNTSFAYSTAMDKAEFLVGLQRTFSKPTFHMIRDSLLDYYLGFLMVSHSAFEEILNTCIIQVTDTGLMRKWDADTVAQASEAGLIPMVHTSDEVIDSLTMGHLHFAWSCLLSGLMLAMILFFVEICCYILL